MKCSAACLPPRTYDLYKLALAAGLDMTEDQKDSLQYITLFNIETRYPYCATW